MRVLVTGADGFIGRHIAAAILAAGHQVVAGVRRITPADKSRAVVTCDFATDLTPDCWKERLVGINAVVNCAGILRERGASTFSRVHVAAPTAMFRACAQAGLGKLIQISALGHPDDGAFVSSKHDGDAELMRLDADWVVVRPSVVYSSRGSYGGMSLLRAMAALPRLLFVPGNGQQRLDPISAEDLSALVVILLERGSMTHRIVEAVGPETLTLETYLRAWRQWLRLPEPWLVIHVPSPLVTIVASLGEWFGSGPLGRTMNAMLARGNTGSPGARQIVTSILRRPARTVDQVLSEQPSFDQDRWHARLYFLEPLLRTLLGLVWVASACIGFLTPQANIQALLAETGLREVAVPLVYGASIVDLVLGVLLLAGWRRLWVGALMLGSVLVYTLFIGVLLPTIWFEPFGGLLKNLVLIPAILMMMALSDRQ